MDKNIYSQLQKMLEENKKNYEKYKELQKEKTIICAGSSILIIGIIGALLYLFSKNILSGIVYGLFLTTVEFAFVISVSIFAAGGIEGIKEIADYVKDILKYNYQKKLKALEIEKNFINNAIDKYNILVSKTENQKQYECVMPREIKYLNLVHSLLPEYAKHGMKLIRNDIKGELILDTYSVEEANVLVDMACEEQKIKSRGRLI